MKTQFCNVIKSGFHTGGGGGGRVGGAPWDSPHPRIIIKNNIEHVALIVKHKILTEVAKKYTKN